MTINPLTDASAPSPATGRKSRAGAIVALTLGFVIAVVGIGGIVVGATTASAFPQQGQDGYLTSSVVKVSTNFSALTSSPVSIDIDDVPFDFGSIRLTAESAASDGQVFIGIGPKADVEAYLSGVHRTEVTSVQMLPFRVHYRDVPGSTVPTVSAPAEQSFWVAASSGSGPQQITMEVRSGDWILVIMNSDASAGITSDLRAAVNSPMAGSVISGLWIGGIIALILGTALIIGGAILLRRRLHDRHREVSLMGGQARDAAAR